MCCGYAQMSSDGIVAIYYQLLHDEDILQNARAKMESEYIMRLFTEC